MRNNDVKLKMVPVARIDSCNETIYSAQTLCSKRGITDQHWAVSHISMGSGRFHLLAGHSVLMVEGIKMMNPLSVQPGLFAPPRQVPMFFVGRYHLVKPDFEEVVPTVTVDAREYLRGYPEEWCLHFGKDPVKSFFLPANDVLAMIEDIYNDAQSVLPYHWAGNKTVYGNDQKAHNCCTWSLAKLAAAGVEVDADGKFFLNHFKAKPKFV